MTTKIAYKIVRYKNGELLSCIVRDNSSFCMKYIPNEFVKPVIDSTLFAFDTLVNARKFWNFNRLARPYQIWECEVVEEKKNKIDKICGNCIPCRLEMFWEGFFDENWLTLPPVGTIFCSNIKLLHKIV